MKQPLLAVLLLVLTIAFIRYKKKIKIKIFFLSLLFPFYYLVISILYKNTYHIQVIALYFAWSFYVFIFSNYWTINKKFLNKFMNSMIIVFFIIILFGIYAISTKGMDLAYFNNRFSFLYENPNFFAQYGQVAFYSILLLIVFDGIKKYNFFWKVLMPLIIFSIAYAAHSRNVMLAMIMFYVVYYIYNLKIKILLKSLFVISIIIFFAVVDTSFLNTASSGRLVIWSYALQDISTNIGLFFGAKDNPDLSVLVHSYNKLNEATGGPVKFHADNMFVELLVEGGIVGIFIFSLPYIYVYRKIKYMEFNQRRVLTAIWVSALAQSFFVTNFTSFFSPASLFFGSIVMLPFMFQRINSK
ncbi:O-antigen ligase family protein [Sulfurovum lithotrophicum]|nr:O-antigen ligase family protein [Sulfurovum lithotrophicum]